MCERVRRIQYICKNCLRRNLLALSGKRGSFAFAFALATSREGARGFN